MSNVVRELPEQEKRVETGPLRFDGDGCGVFIRGDNALWYAKVLEMYIQRLEKFQTEKDPYLGYLRRLMNTLNECDERVLQASGAGSDTGK